VSTHTPGPWRWSTDYQTGAGEKTWALVTGDGYAAHGVLVCDGLPNSPPELNPADARLIAAAPDLLAALVMLAGVVGEQEVGEDDGSIYSLAIAQSAIAKAEGRS
jgi:hypothetical protein